MFGLLSAVCVLCVLQLSLQHYIFQHDLVSLAASIITFCTLCAPTLFFQHHICSLMTLLVSLITVNSLIISAIFSLSLIPLKNCSLSLLSPFVTTHVHFKSHAAHSFLSTFTLFPCWFAILQLQYCLLVLLLKLFTTYLKQPAFVLHFSCSS